MKMLRQLKGLEKEDTSEDFDIRLMSHNEAFAGIVHWNGLIGFDAIIKDWIKDIYEIDLK